MTLNLTPRKSQSAGRRSKLSSLGLPISSSGAQVVPSHLAAVFALTRH
jgi:hypothetical protein